MRPIQILMEEKELKAIDREAKRQGIDRSKLMREAVRRYLAKLVREGHEKEYLESYRRQPQDQQQLRAWARIQSWPAD
jgi:metal-responsive CopG/Arc/MetJ family transcriptional regulator